MFDVFLHEQTMGTLHDSLASSIFPAPRAFPTRTLAAAENPRGNCEEEIVVWHGRMMGQWDPGSRYRNKPLLHLPRQPGVDNSTFDDDDLGPIRTFAVAYHRLLIDN